MKFGLQFFPSVGPAEKSAERYFSESLQLVGEADRLGFSNKTADKNAIMPATLRQPTPQRHVLFELSILRQGRRVSPRRAH